MAKKKHKHKHGGHYSPPMRLSTRGDNSPPDCGELLDKVRFYIAPDLLGEDCSKDFAERVSGVLTRLGFVCQVFDSWEDFPPGALRSLDSVPDRDLLSAIDFAIEGGSL